MFQYSMYRLKQSKTFKKPIMELVFFYLFRYLFIYLFAYLLGYGMIMGMAHSNKQTKKSLCLL